MRAELFGNNRKVLDKGASTPRGAGNKTDDKTPYINRSGVSGEQLEEML